MKKKWVKLLIVVLLLAIVLGVLFLVLKLTKETEKEESPRAVSQTAVKDIEGISYRSEATDGEEISLIREKNVWYYEKDKQFPLDQDYVTNNMVATAAEATASRTLEDPSEDLSQYGLDKPSTVITLKKITGDKVTMSIGDYNESVEGYYLKIDGDKNIYLVDGQMVFAFDMSIYAIADKEDYPKVEQSSYVHVKVEKGGKTVEFKGEVKEGTKATVTANQYLEKQKTWSVSADGGAYVEGNQTQIASFLNRLSDLSYSKMIEYHADNKKLESYGLGKDAVLLTVDYQVLDETTAREVEISSGITEIQCDTLDKQYVLRIGKQVPDDGYSDPEYYVSLADSDVVYTIDAQALENILDINASTYR